MDMGVQGRITLGRLAIIGAALAAVFMMSHFAQTPALADDASRMSLSVSGCSGDECNLDTGETFTLSVNVDAAPGAGYVLVQSFIDYGADLTYNMTDSPAEEMVWPDGSPDVIVRDSAQNPTNPNSPIAPNSVLHGSLTGVIPPLPLSTYEGTVFELELQCSDSFSTNDVQLLPSGDAVAGTSGALFNAEGAEQIIPKVGSITVICGVEPTPTPEPEPTPVVVLPPTGSGALSSGGGSSATLWLVIGALAVVGAAGLGASGWRVTRGRQA